MCHDAGGDDAGMFTDVCFLGTQMQTFWLWKKVAAEMDKLMTSKLLLYYLCLCVCPADLDLHAHQFFPFEWSNHLLVWFSCQFV